MAEKEIPFVPSPDSAEAAKKHLEDFHWVPPHLEHRPRTSHRIFHWRLHRERDGHEIVRPHVHRNDN
jgi:hypothetical protein